MARGLDGLPVSIIPDSSVLIFGGRMLVKGRLAGCRTAVKRSTRPSSW